MNRLFFGIPGLIGLAVTLLFAFQNCSNDGFQSENGNVTKQESSSQDNANSRTCSGFIFRACSVANGVGEQRCNDNLKEWGSCLPTQCNSGYTRDGELCSISPCANGAVNSPSCNLCNSDNYFNGSSCMAKTCAPQSARNCSVTNGVGTQVCNTQGSEYNTCQPSACNSGFSFQNGQCLAIPANTTQSCVPNAQMSCQVPNGNGFQTCNMQGTGYSPCQAASCNSGYSVTGGQCVLINSSGSNICSPNAVRSCLIMNGFGQETCNSQGSAYGDCRVVSCMPGYEFNANTNSCIAQSMPVIPATFQCLTDLNMPQYKVQRWRITGYYGFFLGRSPEKEGYDYWLQPSNNFELEFPKGIELENYIDRHYGTSFSDFKANRNLINATKWINSIYQKNWGTVADTDGLNSWSNELVRLHQNSMYPSVFLGRIYDAFLDYNCSNADNIGKINSTRSHLIVRNTLLIGDYIRIQQTKPRANPAIGDAYYLKLEYFYRQIIADTAANIDGTGKTDSLQMKNAAATVLDRYKLEVDQWVNEQNR